MDGCATCVSFDTTHRPTHTHPPTHTPTHTPRAQVTCFAGVKEILEAAPELIKKHFGEGTPARSFKIELKRRNNPGLDRYTRVLISYVHTHMFIYVRVGVDVWMRART